MNVISPETSGKISFWSFIFSIAVVVIHCSWTADTEIGRLSIALFRDTLARMAVPFFFVCSGYLLARHFDEPGWWRRELAKRITTLGIPYLVWTIAHACVTFGEAHEVMGIGGFGLNPCKMPVLAPLWYIRCLMLFVILSPLFKFAIDRWRGWTLATAYALLLTFSFVLSHHYLSDEEGLGGLLSYGFSIEGLFYFLSGIFILRQGAKPPSRRQAICLCVVGCALVIVRLVLIHKGIGFAGSFRPLLTPVLLASLWCLSRPVPLSHWFAGCPFAVFVMHGVVISAFRYAGGSYRTCNPWIELTAGIILPIVFTHILRRHAPRAMGVVLGGR